MAITSGGYGSNIFGHVALAFTGQGIYSYGTTDPYGASTTAYLQNQFAERDVTITILHTTPAQEQAMINYYNSYYGPGSSYSVASHNCANAALGALDNAGVLNLIMGPVFPSDVGSAVESIPGTITQIFPKGTQVPSAFQGFNRQ